MKEGEKMQISYTFHISNKKSAITTTKKLSAVSKHNMRKYTLIGKEDGHYSSDKIVQLAGSDNLFQDVEKVYHEQFDLALTEYNNKQKRADRKILDYMRYVSQSGKSDLAVEVIIQLGDREFWAGIPEEQKRQMTYIFKDQLKALRQHLPEFVIANAVIHYDEDSPHMQVIGVPVSSGYKRGLSKQCSKTRVFTKNSLEKLQDILRERALSGMERNPELFSGVSLKPKEEGRNSDYSKEFYIQKKKAEYEIVERKLMDSRHTLSEVKEETAKANERLSHTKSELTRKEQETFALVPFRQNDVFPVQGKMQKVMSIDHDCRTVLMSEDDPAKYYPAKHSYPLALVQKSFFEYMYSDIGLQQMRKNAREVEEARQEQETLRRKMETEKEELIVLKEDISSLKQDVEELSEMPCPFQRGDRFEIDGVMITVDFIYTYSRTVLCKTDAGQKKEVPLLDAIRAYNTFIRKGELTEECRGLQQRIDSLKAEWARRTLMVSEVDTVWNVFRHFPAIKEFIFEVGRLLKRPFDRVQLAEVVEVFKEKVLGMKGPEHERTRSRSR